MVHFVPKWFQKIFSNYIWNKKTNEKTIYLTFDDGPVPNITEWVLKILENNKIKATFFVVGENILKYPEIINKINKKGHSIGNHTFHHLKGWAVSTKTYTNDVDKCSNIIKKHTGKIPDLFRPPFGRIKPAQAKLIRKKYKLIMWETLTIDYDKALDKQKGLIRSIRATKNGSIVVFHDSIQAEKNLTYVLPKYIKHFKKQGYAFKSL
jgi:peptidoglycan/xylan/chitin deacetylase (PgdA/CDA1 family)